MAVLRRTRIIAAVAALFVLYFTSQHYNALPRAPSSWSTHDDSGVEQIGPVEALGYEPTPGALIENAHRLRRADDFLPHFEAVRNLTGLSIAETRSSCVWPENQKVNFQYGPDREWFHKEKDQAELDMRRGQWHAFIENDMVPYSSAKNKFSGRGIVIVAGNQDTMMRVRVILRQLLKLGSKIAVEITYWDDELDAATRADLEKIYPSIYFNDLSNPKSIIRIQKSGIYVNYQLKTAAVVNSRFAEPLLLDSDNIPVVDPESLYDTDEYREYGTIFWPDIARTLPQNPMWALTNTPCAMNEYEQESGQLVVDKHRFFYHLQLAAWFNNNQSDYYNQFILGDKDTFRFAWHALKTAFGKPRKWVTSVGTSNYVERDNEWYYCGHTFAQHHPNGSIAFLHGGLLKTVDPEIMSWNRHEKGGFFRHYKRAPRDTDPYFTADVTIKFDGAAYKPKKLPEFHGASCTDMYDVEARDLNDLLPGFEQRFEDIGGYWMLETWEKENRQKVLEMDKDTTGADSTPPKAKVDETKAEEEKPSSQEIDYGY